MVAYQNACLNASHELDDEHEVTLALTLTLTLILTLILTLTLPSFRQARPSAATVALRRTGWRTVRCPPNPTPTPNPNPNSNQVRIFVKFAKQAAASK